MTVKILVKNLVMQLVVGDTIGDTVGEEVCDALGDGYVVALGYLGLSQDVVHFSSIT